MLLPARYDSVLEPGEDSLRIEQAVFKAITVPTGVQVSRASGKETICLLVTQGRSSIAIDLTAIEARHLAKALNTFAEEHNE